MTKTQKPKTKKPDSLRPNPDTSDTHTPDSYTSKVETSSVTQSLRNHFLVSMPGVTDAMFSHSVTYICDHNEHGAMGVVINRPADILLGEVFEQLSLRSDGNTAANKVLSGGPVNRQQGLVLHRDQGSWDSTLRITPEICLTASKDIMHALSEEKGPSSAQFILGYAGWGAGQLESEILKNSWLTVSADSRIMFDVPAEERWNETAKLIGIDLNLLSTVAGHA